MDRGEARRGAVEANREPRLEERPGRVPKRATRGPMKARATFETAEAREEARQGPEARHPRAKQACVTSKTAVEVVIKREGPHEADQTWSNLLSNTRKSSKMVVPSTNKNRWAKS